MAALQGFLDALAVYGVVVLAFGLAFVTAGVARVYPEVEHTPAGLRVLVLSGSAALWPMLLARWIRAVKEGERP